MLSFRNLNTVHPVQCLLYLFAALRKCHVDCFRKVVSDTVFGRLRAHLKGLRDKKDYNEGIKVL